MTHTLFNFRNLAACLGGLLCCMPVTAQDSNTDDTLVEEIITYATRRPQAVMDVPVSVSTLSGAQIEESGIKDVFDLQQNVPGLIVGRSQTSTTSNFSIRGIGSTSNNFGVESSVGLYVDGVYRSRQSSMINDLIDVETVEVLRGPQGTLFGKNTAAGAILVRSVRPSQDTDAFFDVTLGDLNLRRVSAAANIPLTDALAFRGTIFSMQRDGYVDDDAFGSDFYNDRDRMGIRAQLALNDISDDFNMRIIADYSEVDEVCCVGVSRVDGLYSRASLALPTGPIAGSDFAIAALGGTVFTNYDYPAPFLATVPGNVVNGVGFDDYRVHYSHAPSSKNEDRGISLEINKALSNGVSFKSISAYRAFDTEDYIDADFTSASLITRTNIAQQQSFSQEFQLQGDIGDTGSWVLGAYYFGQELKSATTTDAEAQFLDYILLTNSDLAALYQGLNQVVAGAMGALPPVSAPFSDTSFALNEFTQDHDGWALFAQADIPLGEQFVLTLGARYTDETKKADGRFTQSANGPAPDLVAIQTALIAASLGQPFNPLDLLPALQPNQSWGNYLLTELAPRPDVDAKLSDDQTTGTAKITWFPAEDMMVYASFTSGFKAGGTNTERIHPSFNTVFQAETSESTEIGFKGELGPVSLRAAYYMTDFDDFQAQAFTGTGFNLQNAGSIETEGFEVEASFNIGDSFSVDTFYAHNEGDFKSFEAGTCWDATVFHTLTPDPGQTTPGLEVCSRTGSPIGYNPEDRYFVGLTKTFPIGSNELFIRGEYSYASEQFTDGDLDPLTQQDDFGIVNLRLGMDLFDSNANITLWGRNITDERYYRGSFDAPIQVGRMNSYPAESATYGLTFSKRWD